MYSAEGEEVKLSFSIYPSSNVEDWLLEVERSMKASVHDIIEQAIKAYPTVSVAFLLSLQCAPSTVPLCHSLPPPPAILSACKRLSALITAVFLREHLNPLKGQSTDSVQARKRTGSGLAALESVCSCRLFRCSELSGF